MIRIFTLSFTALFFVASTAIAHHSAVAFFDEENMGEVEGEVISTLWRNPHVVFRLMVSDDNGQTTE